MTISVKHKFQSAKPDSSDASLIRPSNWNDEHSITLASARLLGRATAGTGVAEEISLGAGLGFTGTQLVILTLDATKLTGAIPAASLVGPFTAITLTDELVTDQIRSRTGAAVVILAGESDDFVVPADISGESVYAIGETSMQVITSPDNWASGWAGRKTAILKGDDISLAGNTVHHNGNTLNIGKTQATAKTAIGIVDPTGVGQVWVERTTSRVANTSYRNTTGQPIMVAVSATGPNSSKPLFQVSANNSTWITIGSGNADAAGGNGDQDMSAGGGFIIPNNWYYRMSGTGMTIDTWAELS